MRLQGTHATKLACDRQPAACQLQTPRARRCLPRRQLSHHSFKTPKWLEYSLAYLGTMGIEHDPIKWVKHHRCGACV